MKVLIAPVGLYINRVLKTIATIKPDKVYICVAKLGKEPQNEYQKALYEKWERITKKFSSLIADKIKVFYRRKDVYVLQIDTDDYLLSFKDILSLILSLEKECGKEIEVYFDITSATTALKTALITLSIFLHNAVCIYTHANKPLLPEEYPKRVIKDEGGETITIPTPKIDFSELEEGELKSILVAIKTKFKGEAKALTDVLSELNMEVNRANMIKISKLVDKLERYGCVVTKKSGRWKEVKLTMIGSCIADVLSIGS
jgi:chemotaxis protein histidine kinase CheA